MVQYSILYYAVLYFTNISLYCIILRCTNLELFIYLFVFDYTCMNKLCVYVCVCRY